ncbi:MAG: hypothetical protein KA063_05295 [Firmicutes bacterium]|jgi:hypothetical protein|nr:hypothetical protein [Bacillota bacterium]
MKRLLVLFAIMALILVPAMAMAYNPGIPLPDNAYEVEHWEWDDENNEWVHYASGNTQALARCWRSSPGQGSCNKENWTIDFTHHASVAQWCEWSIGGTRWDWRILKPGTYAADCIEFTLKSNNDVFIDYEGFADLLRTEGNQSTLTTIETYYSFGEDLEGAEANGWVGAAALNTDDDLIPDSVALHGGMTTKLFNKIVVRECNSSCEYEDTATITLKLMNIKLWVDPVRGGWLAEANPPTPPQQ